MKKKFSNEKVFLVIFFLWRGCTIFLVDRLCDFFVERLRDFVCGEVA